MAAKPDLKEPTEACEVRSQGGGGKEGVNAQGCVEAAHHVWESEEQEKARAWAWYGTT